ncbi:MAG: hypothetical protein AB7U45_12730 [Desulfamplus sp.]
MRRTAVRLYKNGYSTMIDKKIDSYKKIDKDKFDGESRYCRMLGHEVTFSYCRVAKDNIPCFKIMDCWFDRLPIADYMQSNYSEKEIEKILEKPESKITTLYDLIQKAQSRIR